MSNTSSYPDGHTSEPTETHLPCPECSSSDGFCLYDDGHGYCFVCKANVAGDGTATVEVPKQVKAGKPLITEFSYGAIVARGISAEVCKSHGYALGIHRGATVQIANYRDKDGAVVAQKVKAEGKKFWVNGDLSKAGLWQQHRWRPGGKILLITEGETDLLAWQTVSGDRFAAVSLPNGAAGAKKAVEQQIEYVESFEKVVLCFDDDKAGRSAAVEVAEVLRPGKACIMHLPEGCNDICDAVAAKKGAQLVESFWNASPRRPDGIVAGQDLFKALMTPPATGHNYPWEGLTTMLSGIRRKELVTLSAGTGVGKSTVAGKIAYGLIEQGQKIGYISLEESVTRTVERVVGEAMRKPIHLSRDNVTDEELAEAFAKVDESLCVYNHFGSTDAETLLNRVRHMRIAEGVDYVIVDHLSILVSGWGDGDERRLIDNVMTALRSICEQTGVGMVLISHLRNPTGKEQSHEEGGRPTLSQLRGSKSIAQLSDAVIAIQRDTMDDSKSDNPSVWVLKNRHTGVTGKACDLRYDAETGTMSEVEDVCPF